MADTTDLLAKLQEHLQKMLNDPVTSPDQTLLEECEAFLVPQLLRDPQQLLQLVTSASKVISSLQQDPTPLTRLLERLVEPFSFADILKLEPSVNFVAGLDPGALPFNKLVLTLVQKAAKSSRDTAVLANMPEVISALVKLWLSSSDVGVSDKAGTVLLDLLAADKEKNTVGAHGIGDGNVLQSGGQGLIWRRVFDDKDIYRLFFSLTSLKTNEQASLSKKEKSLAQARLMALLPRIGVLDWHYIRSSHNQAVEVEFGLSQPHEGLVHWAAIYMVDYKDDVLMYMSLLQFYGELISLVQASTTPDQHNSVALDFLIQQGLHDRACSFWLDPDDPGHDPLEVQFLYSHSARYLSTYLLHYPEAFLANGSASPVLQRLAVALDVSPNAWAHGASPAHDLHVLSSLPRIALLPTRLLGTGRRASPLFTVPSKVTNADALMALAHIFKGPEDDLVFPRAPDQEKTQSHEAAAARALYALYISHNLTLYDDLLQHAETVALPQLALASIQVISAVASANWEPLPTKDSLYVEGAVAASLAALPTEEALVHMLPVAPTRGLGVKGIDALLRSPAREKVFLWLLRPPTTYTHLVGGRGDPESSAYKIAMAKWDLLLLVKEKLAGVTSDQNDLANLRDAINARLAEGPWGAALEAGSRIGTLEL